MNYYGTNHECIYVLEDWLSDEEYIGFLKGNVIKYMCRMGKKPGVSRMEDAEKAYEYNLALITKLEELEEVQEEKLDDI